MTRLQFSARLLAAAITAAALLVLLVLIWGLRPPLPNLDRSETGPPAGTVARQIVDVIAWGAALALILRLIANTARAVVGTGLPRSGTTVARLHHALARQSPLEKHRRPLIDLAAARAYPLIVRTPERTPPQLNAGEPSTPAAAQEAVAAPRSQPVTGKSISILGPLKIEGTRQRGRKLRSLTAQMLLYLVLHPDGATVEQLADVILPDIDPEQSRNRLWQSASEARRVLGDGFRRDDDGRYALDRTDVQIDLDELNSALGDHDRGENQPDPARLEHALALFRGDPLPDTDWTWAEGHIRHLRATYVDLIEQVGRASLDRGDPRGALALAERGLDVDKLNEALWRLAMEADSAAGLREAVAKRFAELRDLLARELALEPTTETRSLYLHLLGQR